MNLFSTDLWCKHQKKFNNIHFSKPILFSLGLLFTLITAIKAFPPAVNANAYLPTFSRLSSSWPNAPTLKLFLFILKIISSSRKSPPPTVLLLHLLQLHHLTQQRSPSQSFNQNEVITTFSLVPHQLVATHKMHPHFFLCQL